MSLSKVSVVTIVCPYNYCEMVIVYTYFHSLTVKESRDTTIFFFLNTYKSLQNLFLGSHYIETKKMVSLFFLFSNILAREGVIIEQKSRKIAKV